MSLVEANSKQLENIDKMIQEKIRVEVHNERRKNIVLKDDLNKARSALKQRDREIKDLVNKVTKFSEMV